MTDEMLDLARRNAAEAGATNVEFRKGRIESIPLPRRAASTSSSATASSTSRRTRRRSSPRSRASCDPVAGWASAMSSPTTPSRPTSARPVAAFVGLHRRRAVVRRVPRRAGGRRPDRHRARSHRMPSAMASTARSSRRPSPPTGRPTRSVTCRPCRSAVLAGPCCAPAQLTQGCGCGSGGSLLERLSLAPTGNGNATGSVASRLTPCSSNRSRPRSVTSIELGRAAQGEVGGDAGDARSPHHPVAAGRRDGHARRWSSRRVGAPDRRSAGGPACSRSSRPRSCAGPGPGSRGTNPPSALAIRSWNAQSIWRASPGGSSGSLQPNSSPPSSRSPVQALADVEDHRHALDVERGMRLQDADRVPGRAGRDAQPGQLARPSADDGPAGQQDALGLDGAGRRLDARDPLSPVGRAPCADP